MFFIFNYQFLIYLSSSPHNPATNSSEQANECYRCSFWVPTHNLYTCQTHEKFSPNSEFWTEKNAFVGSVAIFISAHIDFCRNFHYIIFLIYKITIGGVMKKFLFYLRSQTLNCFWKFDLSRTSIRTREKKCFDGAK